MFSMTKPSQLPPMTGCPNRSSMVSMPSSAWQIPLSPDVDLRRLDEAPSQVGGPWHQSPNQQEVDHQVQVPGDRDPVDVEPPCERRRVVRLPLIVGEHGPEPPQRLGRNARPELRDVPLQIRADEGEAPVEALFVAACEVALRKAAATPQPPEPGAGNLPRIEGMQLAVGDAPRQRFARLLQQVDGGRAEQQEQSRPLPGLPAFIDDAAQRGEQPRHPVHLVENEQAAGVLVAVLLDIADLGEIARPFQVHVGGIAFASELPGEGRLAGLTRSEQDHRRIPVQQSGSVSAVIVRV